MIMIDMTYGSIREVFMIVDGSQIFRGIKLDKTQECSKVQ